jgi:hypothetical protein
MTTQEVKAYIHDNKSTLISDTIALFDVVNETTFANATVNNINEQSREWNESFIPSDDEISNIARRYYNEYGIGE